MLTYESYKQTYNDYQNAKKELKKLVKELVIEWNDIFHFMNKTENEKIMEITIHDTHDEITIQWVYRYSHGGSYNCSGKVLDEEDFDILSLKIQDVFNKDELIKNWKQQRHDWLVACRAKRKKDRQEIEDLQKEIEKKMYEKLKKKFEGER